MRSVLFVDDEPKVLEGLENLMFPFMDEWEVSTAQSGQEALDFLVDTPIDVLVTDMRMPGMGGPELLEAVKAKYPKIVRFVLSGHSELEAALKAMPVAHQFLSKPCDANTLTGALERACNLQQVIDDATMREVLGTIDQLPARPVTYARLTQIMAQEDWSLGAVAQVVEQDLAIATKVLHVASTAFFSRGQTVCDVRQAVPRLGAKFVRDLVLAFEVYTGFAGANGLDIDLIQSQGFAVGAIAKEMVPEELKEDAFLAGLVQDIGRLVLATSLPEKSAAVQALVKEKDIPPHQAEHELFGVTHAEIGAYLLGLWGMSYPVIESVANHHTPQRVQTGEFSIACAIDVANALYAEALTGEVAALDTEYLTRIGVGDQVEAWQQIVSEQLEVNDG